MSTITLDRAIVNAIAMPIGTSVPTPANAATIAFCEAILAVKPAAATIAPTPTPVAASKPAKASKPVATLPNFAGKQMASDEGTRSEGQADWLKANTDMSAADIKAISMVDASNWRAYVSGRITAAQYNELP